LKNFRQQRASKGIRARHYIEKALAFANHPEAVFSRIRQEMNPKKKKHSPNC
jgi:hypothetical protein